jgi:hypothetical protein
MRRALAFFFAVLASGCFRWAPITSLSRIEDDRILVHENWGSRSLVHATANERVIEAQEEIGGRPVVVDPTQSPVLVRRLNVPATAAIIGVSALGVAGTVFAVAVLIALLTRPVFEAGSGGAPP